MYVFKDMRTAYGRQMFKKLFFEFSVTPRAQKALQSVHESSYSRIMFIYYSQWFHFMICSIFASFI